jgi:hypothetical protein
MVADDAWKKGLSSDGKWDRPLLCKLAQPYIDKGWAHFRPDDEQNEFKIVMGVKTAHVEQVWCVCVCVCAWKHAYLW